MYVHSGHAGACGGHKRVLDPTELELEVLSELGTEPKSSARAVQDGNCRATSPAPALYFPPQLCLCSIPVSGSSTSFPTSKQGQGHIA